MPSFSFVNTSFLFLSPLVLLPVIIHLISRKKRKIVEYPSLKFLNAAYLKRMKHIRLNELLLLLIRTLIVAFLIFSFARLLMFVPSADIKSGAAYAIIIDESYSLEYRNSPEKNAKNIEELKKIALDTIASLKNGPKFLLISSSTPDFEKKYMSAAEASEKIKSLKTSYGIFSLTKSLTSLEKFEDYSQLSGIFVISDFVSADRGAAMSLGGFIEKNTWLKHGPRMTLISCGPQNVSELKKNKNLAITAVTLSDERIIAGKPFQIRCRVKNYSQFDISSEISLMQDDQKISSTPFSIGPQNEAEALITHVLMNSGNYPLRLSLPDDAVIADNYFNLALAPVSSLYVLILTESDEGSHAVAPDFKYIAAALNPLRAISLKDGLVIQPMIINTKIQPAMELKNYDAVIACGLTSISSELSQKLQSYVNDGGGILFLPPSGDFSAFKGPLAGLMPLAFNDASAAVSSPDENNYFNLTSIKYDHAIFEMFKNKNSGDIEQPRFYKVAACGDKNTDASGASVIARFDNSIAALAEKKIGRGISMIFTGYIDPAGSNFADSPLFVPFVHQLIYYLNKNRSQASKPMIVGTALREKFEIAERVSGVSCLAPGNITERKLEIKTSANSLFAEISDTYFPGFYTIYIKKEDKISQKKYAFNFDARESEIGFSDYEDLCGVLSRHGLLLSKDSQAAAGSDKKIEMAPYLFLAVLLLLVCESYVAYKLKK